MSINEDTIVVAGKKVPNVIDVESSTTIKHASTGKVYESEDEATSDVNDPATETTESDIKEMLLFRSINCLIYLEERINYDSRTWGFSRASI